MLAGCGSEPTQAEDDPTSATTEQYASVIARHEPTLREVGDEKSTCFLDVALEPTGPEAGHCISDGASAFDAMVDIKDRFDGLTSPPDEIAELVQRMQSATEHVMTTPEFDVATQCEDAESDECATSVSTMSRGLEEVMIPELDAWSPYF